MPELPELEVIREQLIKNIQDKRIAGFKVIKPYILKNYFTDTLTGETVQKIERKGKYLILNLSKHIIILHLMLRGKLNYAKGKKVPKSTAAWISFADDSFLSMSEQGHKKRVALYIIPKGKMIPHVISLGIDPLSHTFTKEALKKLLSKWRCQLKTFLRKQTIFAGIGNAYADEILWNAGLSPFQMTRRLDASEIARLHTAIRETLAWAILEVRKAKQGDKRTFLHIHGKKGKPCPRCNTIIHIVSFADSDTFYCPICQTHGKILKDRRISKLFR